MDITSLQNPRIKQIVKLRDDKKTRKQAGLMLVEGFDEIQLALAAAGTSGGATLKLIHLLGNAVSEFPCEQALAIALPQEVKPIRTPKQLNLVRFHHGSRALIQGVVECSLGKEVADFFSKFLSDNMALN